ncbi:cytochrome c [Amnibacterium sp.]|uniref:cytochrome bc1 complex diheme cytochrome c subunit n=1 Tax=Amnibacterium sp. TaxID=1872496 RepID=UPI0026356A02|nr:cytochrome c [Amnibacterium sp.]MCU1475104.1 cystathionine beta-lyase [Amnibacterium sp.]
MIRTRRAAAAGPVRTRKRGRRSPLASVALVAVGLLLTGGAYTLFTASSGASAAIDLNSAQAISQGKKLFQANCATCHGLALQGTVAGPSLIGVGAAAVDFQVGTGRMPLAQDAPQAQDKPPVFDDTQTKELAAYVASVAPGPGLPSSKYLQLSGNATRGAELFRINCAMCHNVAGAGGALTEGKYAPNLNGVTPAHIYEAMLTGPQNMPVFNDANISPQDKADIITALKATQQNANVGGFDLGSLGPVAEGLFLWIFGLGAIVAFTVWLTAKAN